MMQIFEKKLIGDYILDALQIFVFCFMMYFAFIGMRNTEEFEKAKRDQFQLGAFYGLCETQKALESDLRLNFPLKCDTVIDDVEKLYPELKETNQ